MISIPGSLSFAKLMLMSSTPAKCAGDARYESQDPFIQSTLSIPSRLQSVLGVRSSASNTISTRITQNSKRYHLCYTRQFNFSCNLPRNFVAPLWQTLHESSSRNVFVAVTVARSRTDFYFSQRLRQQKKLRDMFISGHVTLGNNPWNLCRKKIARQVARKIS